MTVINPLSIIKDVSCIINGVLVIIPVNNPLAALCPTSTTASVAKTTSKFASTSTPATSTISLGTSSTSLSFTSSTSSSSSSSRSTTSISISTSISVPASTTASSTLSSISAPSTEPSSSSTSTSAPSTSSTTASTSAATPSSYNAFDCPTDLPLSCHNTTSVDNLCCFNYPGGSLLQTQFWDSNPATGPNNSWTIHGLWPDNCDGTYEQYCDDSRDYTNITQILQSFGRQDLVDYMTSFWVPDSGTPETFWEHEFGKHGTCISTFSPSCYDMYQPTEEVPDFFNRTVSLFQSLPSYQWLADAGIVPSTSVTYTAQQIQDALSANRGGHQVYLGCSNGALNEIWYYFNVQGSIQTGTFVPSDVVGASSSCPDTGIQYLPKVSSSPTSTTAGATSTASATASATPTGPPFTGTGYLYVVDGGSQTGSIITDGSWYNNAGTPATIRTNTTTGDGPFTINTSKGLCAISPVNSTLACGASVTTGSAFTRDGNLLAYGGSDAFGANAVPSGSTHGVMYAGSGYPGSISLQ